LTAFLARIDGARTPSTPVLCDAWLASGQRIGDELPGHDAHAVLGHWPGELETDAVLRLAQAVGDQPTWEALEGTPPVAQKLAERARPQPLDLQVVRHLQHLQQVCHRPRLHLRVEEERLPVSRARRTPVRAVADLVAHPGDWEHRTLRSIQPARVLARQVEDEWNLYENRVAVRLVDHLLAYLAKRLEELRRIGEILEASRDYSDEIRRTSFRRAHRIATLWSSTLQSETEEELPRTRQHLERAQRELQALLDAPLYQRVPRQQHVAVSLKPTNILVNDPHYRKVAALWRSWAEFGHKRQQTHQQRAERRQREASAWDRFVLHLVARGFRALGWAATPLQEGGWQLVKRGWAAVRTEVDSSGLLRLSSKGTLRILPLCADLAGALPKAVLAQLEALDRLGDEVVVAHVGGGLDLADTDRASGWSIGGRAVLLACSPWAIDSEERMARVLHGWLCRAATMAYPVTRRVPSLPTLPRGWDWLRYDAPHLVALRAPDEQETAAAQSWATAQAKELDTAAQRAKAAKQAFAIAPREAVRALQSFLGELHERLAGLQPCPVCGAQGLVEPRPGRRPDGSDATWWAICSSCSSEWGTRPCTGCGGRYRALLPQMGLDLARAVESTPGRDWPDKVLGLDVWAQPCSTGATGQFRCPGCGACSGGACARCQQRSAHRG
jgi:hypothetical protein